MFKKLEELLEAGSISKEVAEALDGEITTALKGVRDEAAKYRTKLKETEEAYTQKLEEQRVELESKIEEAKKAGESEVAAKFEEKLKAVEGEKAQLEEKARKAVLEATVSKALAEVNVIDPDLARLYIEKHVELDGDDAFINIGGEKLTFDNGVKKLFEDKPHLLTSSGNGGSGAGGGGGSSSYANKKKSDMSAAEKAAFIKDNGNEAYLNLQE